MIRIGLVIAVCMLALIVAAGGSPPARAARDSHPLAPQPINLTLRFKMAEDMG